MDGPKSKSRSLSTAGDVDLDHVGLGRWLALPWPCTGKYDTGGSASPGLDLPTVCTRRADQTALAGLIAAIDHADEVEVAALLRVQSPPEPGRRIFSKHDRCGGSRRQRDRLGCLHLRLSGSRCEPGQREKGAKDSGGEIWVGKFFRRKHLCEL